MTDHENELHKRIDEAILNILNEDGIYQIAGAVAERVVIAAATSAAALHRNRKKAAFGRLTGIY